MPSTRTQKSDLSIGSISCRQHTTLEKKLLASMTDNKPSCLSHVREHHKLGHRCQLDCHLLRARRCSPHFLRKRPRRVGTRDERVSSKSPTLDQAIILAFVVGIRTVVGVSLNMELKGSTNKEF